MKNQYTLLIISRSVFLRIKIILHKIIDKIRTHILCPVAWSLKIVRIML